MNETPTVERAAPARPSPTPEPRTGMPLTIEPLRVSRDARGAVSEPLDAAGLAAQRNVHVVLTEPGCVRGNHLHRHATEVMTVYGPALVRTREAGVVRDHPVPAGAALRFTIPPGVSHAVQNTGKAPMLLVSFVTREHDPAAPDVESDVLIEPAPTG
jgi:dTDP-4-dehydrorhamnose 3,5-epimerase-like enzyme